MTHHPAAHFINGAWVAEGALGDSLNPADGSRLGQFHRGSAALVAEAAGAARASVLKWSSFAAIGIDPS
jgi:acyl-CoA reductase-like NAD-dependent aldehyde dehydrogenase